MDPIYLDNAATTPPLPEVLDAVRRAAEDAPGNPASAHAAGRKARRLLEDAREQVAARLGAHPDEVVFTSGGTESNNLALLGLTADRAGPALASAVEHPSVLEPLRHLGPLIHLPVTAEGTLDLAALGPNLAPPHLDPPPRLVAVQLANHETGAIHPVAAVARALPPGVPLHCDAVQAVGKVAVDFHALGPATLTATAHKFHGPRGVGVLLVRRGMALRPRTFGGHQQHGLRPGTEPVALAVGFALALELADRDRTARTAHVVALRTRLLGALRDEAAPVVLNGPAEGGLPHTLNLSFPGLESAALLMALDLAGVACSAGAACASGSLQPSPVLRAMNVPDAVLRSAVRLSLSALLTASDLDEAARRICHTVNRLRHGVTR